MKTFLRHALWVLPMVMAGRDSLIAADPVIPCATCNCAITVNWRLPVDLNGDGVPDFDHIRLQTEKRCGDDVWWTLQRDEIEAFYPESHVDVLVYYNRRIVTPYRAALSPGQLIPPDPEPDCSWPAEDCWDWVSRVPDAQRILQTEGLGIIHRTTDHFPCYFPEVPEPCFKAVSIGVLGTSSLGPGDVREVLVGFRLTQDGDWHPGWMRLQFRQPWPKLRPPYPEIGGVFLIDYAIHPEPETPIAAGERPRPTLHASVEGDEIVVSWHSAWTGYVLERSPAVSSGAWEPVPGVENNTIRLPKAGPPAFFRLEQE